MSSSSSFTMTIGSPPKKVKTESSQATSSEKNTTSPAAEEESGSAAASVVDPNILKTILARLNQLEEDHNNLKGRVDHITMVFEPATQHALLETAIYAFVDNYIPDDWKSEEKSGPVKHGIATLCMEVLAKLMDKTKKEKKLSWHGPSSRKKNKKSGSFPAEAILDLVLSGLAGLAFFIKTQEETMLKKWNPGERNNVTHNGSFLHLFGSPDKNNRSQVYDARKQQVKNARITFQEEAEKKNLPVSIELGVRGVVDALKAKNQLVDDCENKIKALNIELAAIVNKPQE